MELLSYPDVITSFKKLLLSLAPLPQKIVCYLLLELIPKGKANFCIY